MSTRRTDGAHESEVRSGLELDHVFIIVEPGASETAELERLGLVVDHHVVHHEGQGTASVFVAFDDAYLELLWVDPTVPPPPAYLARLGSRDPIASRFGLGLRRADPAAPLRVPTLAHTAAWLRPGTSIAIVRDLDPTEPFLFVVPPSMAFGPLEQRPGTAAPSHRLGVHRLTQLRLVISDTSERSAAFHSIGEIGRIVFAVGPEPLLELTFDGGARSATVDARPALPLLLRF